MPTNQTEEWIEEFYEKFVDEDRIAMVPGPRLQLVEIKDFIRKTLLSEKQKIVESIKNDLWCITDTLGAAAMLEARNLPQLVKQACKDIDRIMEQPTNKTKEDWKDSQQFSQEESFRKRKAELGELDTKEDLT